MRIISLIVFLLFGVSVQLCLAQGNPTVDVMSFNIRYGLANDGENRWDLRKENVVTTIEDTAPDLLGLQEALPFQVEFILQNVDGYHYVGRSRETKPNGEQCGILISKTRFDILEQGHFWLSETPNTPGSKSWDSSLPRMATWVKVFDRQSKISLYFVNTHFDHRGKIARAKSAQVIVDRMKQFDDQLPQILLGDFNTGPKSEPYNILVDSFVDTFQSLGNSENGNGTFGGFRGKTDGARIDFVFASKQLEVVSASIDRREFDGKNPSDHYPVTATLRVNPNSK